MFLLTLGLAIGENYWFEEIRWFPILIHAKWHFSFIVLMNLATHLLKWINCFLGKTWEEV